MRDTGSGYLSIGFYLLYNYVTRKWKCCDWYSMLYEDPNLLLTNIYWARNSNEKGSYLRIAIYAIYCTCLLHAVTIKCCTTFYFQVFFGTNFIDFEDLTANTEHIQKLIK